MPHISLLYFLLIAASYIALPVVQADDITGEITQISSQSVTIGGKKFAFEPGQAECYDASNQKMTCETLVAVGYADEASIMIDRGRIKRIRVIRLNQ